MYFHAYLRTMESAKHDDSLNWLLWIQQDGECDRLDKLWAGRVKFQDDAIATAYCILDDALHKLEPGLWGGPTIPLF